MNSFSFQPVVSPLFVMAVAVGLVLLLWVVPSYGGLPPRRRHGLIALRLAIFLLVIVVMMRPALVVTEVKRHSASLLLLLDHSRSMLVEDSFGGKSRWEGMGALVQSSEAQLQQLSDVLDVKAYLFDTEPRAVRLFAEGGGLSQNHAGSHPRSGNVAVRQGLGTGSKGDAFDLRSPPTGEQTAIGWAIEDVLRREAGKRLAGIVLLTDGAQRAYAPRDTPPQLATRRLVELGCPLYTVAIGQASGLGQVRDLALKDLISSQTVYVKNRLAVRATLRVDGLAGKRVRIELLYETSPGKSQVVATRQVTASTDGQSLPVELDYVPQKVGEHKLTLRAVPYEGELVTTNNHLSTFVTILKGGIHVLYLEGEMRREQKFLRGALDASPNIKLDFWLDRRKPHEGPADLRDQIREGEYDVVIVGDLDATALTDITWRMIAQRVDTGMGLIMLGGFHSFGPGGYGATPIGPQLPVVMNRLERQLREGPIRKDLHIAGPLKMRPTRPLGISSPILRLSADAGRNGQLWSELPPLLGANRFRALKPSAVVLVESDDSRRTPLLVAGIPGPGRVLAFAGDSTWRWPMRGFDQPHKRFWRQIVLWLARKDVSSENSVWIELQPRRYRPSSRVVFAVGAGDPSGEAMAGVQFEAHVERPDGTRRPVRLSRHGDQTRGTFLDTGADGDYTVTVTAKKDGSTIGSTAARFLIFAQDMELDNPAADPGLLANLARMTEDFGGEAVTPEEFSALLSRIAATPTQLDMETHVKHNFWDTWVMFSLLVTLLSAEWYLRKRWGLV
ncbi:MAG: hypothetical protein ACC645_05045 [Pirellulales bacterium]